MRTIINTSTAYIHIKTELNPPYYSRNWCRNNSVCCHKIRKKLHFLYPHCRRQSSKENKCVLFWQKDRPCTFPAACGLPGLLWASAAWSVFSPLLAGTWQSKKTHTSLSSLNCRGELSCVVLWRRALSQSLHTEIEMMQVLLQTSLLEQLYKPKHDIHNSTVFTKAHLFIKQNVFFCCLRVAVRHTASIT